MSLMILVDWRRTERKDKQKNRELPKAAGRKMLGMSSHLKCFQTEKSSDTLPK